jgi:hypothetical protein
MQDLSMDVSELESTNEVLTTDIKRLKSDLSKATAAAAKSEQVLKDRTGHWISWRERAQQELLKVKNTASRRIMALEKKNEQELLQERSVLNKAEREHTKHVSALEKKLSNVSSESKKEVARLEDEYCAKVDSLM